MRAPDGHLSTSCVAAALKRSTRHRDEQPHRCLSDLAPGEVYPASPITRAPGGLLHHRFTLTPAPGGAVAVCSLLHFLAGCPGWVLPTAMLYGARTFLGRCCQRTRPSCRPIRVGESTGPSRRGLRYRPWAPSCPDLPLAGDIQRQKRATRQKLSANQVRLQRSQVQDGPELAGDQSERSDCRPGSTTASE